MPNTKNLVIGGRQMILAVGPNKTGKTVGLVTLPGPVLVYNFDGPGRMQPVKFMWPDLEIEYRNVGPKRIDSSEEDQCVISYADFCEEFTNLQDDCPWGTIGAADSFTSMTTTSVNFQLIARMGGKWSLKDVKKTKGGIPIASWDEFNGEATAVALMLDVAKNLPCHIFMTAHPIPKTETNKEGEVIKKYTTLASYGVKVATIAPGYFTEIWRFERQANVDPSLPPVSYTVHTQPSITEDIGSSALPLPAKMDITNKKLWEVVLNELKAFNVKLETKRILEATKPKEK